jgi:hypothetical protein
LITNTIAARNAARVALAADTPAVILVEKLGFSASTADKWSHAVGAARNLYAALTAGSADPRRLQLPNYPCE